MTLPELLNEKLEDVETVEEWKAMTMVQLPAVAALALKAAATVPAAD